MIFKCNLQSVSLQDIGIRPILWWKLWCFKFWSVQRMSLVDLQKPFVKKCLEGGLFPFKCDLSSPSILQKPASSCNEQNMDQGGSNISHLKKFCWYYMILPYPQKAKDSDPKHILPTHKWIGLGENPQETMVLPMTYGGFHGFPLNFPKRSQVIAFQPSQAQLFPIFFRSAAKLATRRLWIAGAWSKGTKWHKIIKDEGRKTMGKKWQFHCHWLLMHSSKNMFRRFWSTFQFVFCSWRMLSWHPLRGAVEGTNV